MHDFFSAIGRDFPERGIRCSGLCLR
jgi:hypothetical protein